MEGKTGTSGSADHILIFMPEGVEAGEYVSPPRISVGKEQFYSGTKGEFPFLLTALSCLKKDGSLAAIFPGAMLYREEEKHRSASIL